MCIIWYDPWDFRKNKKWSFSKTRMGSVGFRAIFDFRNLPRDADTLIPKWRFHDFWASRWGRAAKVKKIAFSLGRCRKSRFSHSHAAWGSKKKWSPCSMGVPKVIFSTPLERECSFEKCINFCCCEFLWFWGSKQVAKMGTPVRFFIFDNIIWFFKKCKKWKCC